MAVTSKRLDQALRRLVDAVTDEVPWKPLGLAAALDHAIDVLEEVEAERPREEGPNAA